MIEEWHIPQKAQISAGFTVRRSLPYRGGKGVGPFIFLDHIGPIDYTVDGSLDVKPHPHIGLATITYLYAGELVHRDSLGTVQPIRPFDVNWMVAGKGITHSERAPKEMYGQKQTLHGIQIWIALPKDQEVCEPSFQHFPSEDLPIFDKGGILHVLLAGELFEHKSPVKCQSGLLYVALEMKPFSSFLYQTGDREFGFYLSSGRVSCDGRSFQAPGLMRFQKNSNVKISSDAISQGIFIGGPTLHEKRYMEWNFVATETDKIAAAKKAWAEGKFPSIQGETDAMPLP